MNNHRLVLLILITLSGFAQSFGQTPDRSLPGDNRKSDASETSCPVYLVTVEVSLRQEDVISELSKENFILYDNDERQDISYWTRIEGSGSASKDVRYALGYNPPVYSFDGKLRRIRVEVRNKANKRVKAHFSPTQYRATEELPAEVPIQSDTDETKNEFGVWGSISFDSPTLIGKTPDARFGSIGLRYGRILAASQDLAFSWTIDAIPVAVLSTNRFTIVPTGSGSFTVQREREHTYGAGLSPIGLKLNFRPTKTVQPFATGSAGFLFFSKDVPVPGAARFNFTYDFGGGIQIVRESRRAITVGYKYQHISNGYHSPINPGVDVQVIYLGYSIRR